MQARLATAAALTTAFIAAGAVAAAPASAAAENNVRDYNTTIVGSSGVNYRTGPGTGYTSKGLVATGDKITVTATSNSRRRLLLVQGQAAGQEPQRSAEGHRRLGQLGLRPEVGAQGHAGC